MVIAQSCLLSGGQCLVAGRAASTAGLFSLGPAAALHHGFRGLTVVALGILWDSPGRVPASHRLPRAHARNLLIKHCHMPSSLAGGETVRGPRPKGHQVRQGASFLGGTPRKKSTSSHLGAYLPRRSNRASHDTDRVSRGLRSLAKLCKGPPSLLDGIPLVSSLLRPQAVSVPQDFQPIHRSLVMMV